MIPEEDAQLVTLDVAGQDGVELIIFDQFGSGIQIGHNVRHEAHEGGHAQLEHLELAGQFDLVEVDGTQPTQVVYAGLGLYQLGLVLEEAVLHIQVGLRGGTVGTNHHIHLAAIAGGLARTIQDEEHLAALLVAAEVGIPKHIQTDVIVHQTFTRRSHRDDQPVRVGLLVGNRDGEHSDGLRLRDGELDLLLLLQLGIVGFTVGRQRALTGSLQTLHSHPRYAILIDCILVEGRTVEVVNLDGILSTLLNVGQVDVDLAGRRQGTQQAILL